jgi:KDO2-lipid IV(A) lauroyltransferase
MKKILQYIVYLLFLAFAGFFAIIPFRIMYVLSDGVYGLLFYVVGYRKKVVYQNLKNSFPEKSEEERKAIAKKFYKHLADLFVESLKGFTMSSKSVMKRHKLMDNGIGDEYHRQGKSVMVVVGHYNNWEWGSMSGGLQLESPVMVLYKPLSNQFIDRFLEKRRRGFGSELVAIRQTARAFENRKDTPYFYILAADQSPGKTKRAYWIDFLNQDTACLHGPETYARRYNLVVIYLEIQKIKRGFYQMVPKVITENPSELEDGEVVGRYMKLLEESIRKKPEYWLWSHRRWKKKRKTKTS